MLVKSFLLQGTGAGIAKRLARSFSKPPDALVLFSLGADHSILTKAVQQNNIKDCPAIYLTETYGILGFDEQIGKNVELLEKGRGSEYGCVGGSGGQGCLAVGFFGGAVAGSTADFPDKASACMVIADQSGAWEKIQHQAPLHYGGITKECWKVAPGGKLEAVPYFWVADVSSEPIGVSTFTGDASEAVTKLLEKMPEGREPSGAVGLFPCFTRGINEYGAENVEPDAISRTLENPRIYGMFAHGELGPKSFLGFASNPNHISCVQHSMTSILTMHTKPLN